jgi:hypothetical protein
MDAALSAETEDLTAVIIYLTDKNFTNIHNNKKEDKNIIPHCQNEQI